MTLNPKSIAIELDWAVAEATPIELLTERFPSLTWDDARAIARASDELRRDRGQRQIGYKLGWTSAQMREALGIERPNWGTLWADQVLGAEIVDRARLIHPKVEPELVYRSGRDFEAGVTAAEIHAAGEWALGLEIVDPRYPSFDFDWLDNTADNSSSGAIVLGPFEALSISPADVTVSFEGAGEVRNLRQLLDRIGLIA